MHASTLPHRAPPTPPGLPGLGHAWPFLTTRGLPLDFLARIAARHGDLVHFTIGPQHFYLVVHPDLVNEVLVRRVKEFDKPDPLPGQPASLARFLGQGILTATYDPWRPQRKLIQPLMHTQTITRYAGTMAGFGEQLLASWTDGEQRDIHADMMQVTIWIIADTMFGMDAAQTPALQAASDRAQAIAVADITSPLPAWMARGRDRQAAELNAYFSGLVDHFMRERRAQGSAGRHDLLTLLMDTRDEDGRPMPDDLVRDNILTLFMAGHETTANTLTWVFYYLDQNPAVAAALHQEVDAVLAGRPPTLADLPALPYTLMVIKEAMRLEPTVAIIPRTLKTGAELGGFHLRAGSIVFLAPYLLHRDPRWWPQPERFDPARFSADNEPRIPKYAYLPFGGGPRICLGNHFSLMEAQLLLALIASRYRLELAPGARVVPLRQVTTSPLHGLPMRIHRRAP